VKTFLFFAAIFLFGLALLIGAGEAIHSFATREDAVEPSLGQEKALKNAPDPDDGHFRVPRVIG
jgi:hypothetical protein